MAEIKGAWGIDIGQSALKAIKLRHVDATDQVVAVAFDYIPYPKILSQPDAIPEELVPQAIETFLSRNDIKGDSIAISVPSGTSALVRFVQLPPVEASKLPDVVKYEAKQQIPFDLAEVIWDYQPVGTGVEESGYLLDAEVALCAMKRDDVMRSLRPYNNAKVEVDAIQIASLSLYNSIAYDELGIRRGQPVTPKDEYIIILDMGCDFTTLLVTNGPKIWVRNVPLGGNHFTRALTKEMKLSFAKAEHLKCNATKSPDPRAVFQALRQVFNDYVSEIQRSIGYFSSVNRQAKISKVIGLGNGFKLAGLQKFLQQNLQYEVERPDAFRALAGDSVINAPLFQDNLLSFAVPYGLSLQALNLSRIHTTLLPKEITTARLIKRKKPWAVAAAATLLVGACIPTIINGMQYSNVHRQEFIDVEQESKTFGGEVTTAQNNYNAQVTRFDAKQAELKTLVEGRRELGWMEVINAVDACLPRDPGNVVEVLDITQRQLISIQSINSQRQASLGTWFEGLDDDDKVYMLAEDSAQAPSGEGYIITLQGMHWHFEEGKPDFQKHNYVVNTLVKNLEQWQAQIDGYLPRDVRRMGISHVTLVDSSFQPIVFNPLGHLPGDDGPQIDILGGPQGQGGPMESGGQFGPDYYQQSQSPGANDGDSGSESQPDFPEGELPEGAREILQTEFTVQFVYKPVAEEERPDAAPLAPAGETAPQ